MKEFFLKILPVNKKDYCFWLLMVALLLPLIYISFNQMFDYMMLNFGLLCVIVGFLLFNLIRKLVFKKKINFINSKALLFLSIMMLWLFIGSFFSQNLMATWFGEVDGYHTETSIFQFFYYFSVALLVILSDKRNIKHLLYTMLIVINTVIIIQFFKNDYGYGFINRNHTGYYLSVSVSITIGMILYSKNIYELIFLSVSLLFHFTSIVLNHSLGPIIGLIALFVCGFIYYLIHNRKMLVRLSGIILSCIMVFSFFDFVPKVKELRTESAPVITQLYDLSLFTLNKMNIISDQKLEDIVEDKGGLTEGSDGYDRLDMWKISVQNMMDFPVFGLGVGAWNTYNEDMPNRAPHNEFLEYGVSGGFPVLILYVLSLVYLFIIFRKKHKSLQPMAFISGMAVLNYLVQSLFGNIMPFTAPIFYFALGLMIKFVDLKQEDNVEGTETLVNQETEEQLFSDNENATVEEKVNG